MKPTPQPPQRLPVLTEVVLLPSGDAPGSAPVPHVSDTAFAATAPSPLSDWAPSGSFEPQPLPAPTPVPEIDEAALAQRVLTDLDRQLDLMFEQRLREAMSPVLTRLTDTLVRELRHQLAGTLREMVTRAVSQELDRVRRG
jgi:hypothetical protein